MKRKKCRDWVVAYDGTKGRDAYMMKCTRCGAEQRFTLPIAVNVYVAAGKAFEKMHKNCEEK